MEITYQGLGICLPIEGVVQVEDFFLDAAFNRHIQVRLALLMEEEGLEERVHSIPEEARIEVSEGRILFSGKIITAEIAPDRGLYYLYLEALSDTFAWDLIQTSRSFQDLDMTYSQVFAKALEDQPQAEVMDCVTDGAAIPDLILQYEESGWEFLTRLASRFQTFLIPDACAGYGRVYFGIPEDEDEEVLNTGEYQAVKDMGRYYQVNLDGELLSQEIMKWQVRSERSFCLAQKVVFCGIETIVTRVCYETVKGELCRFYELSRKKGVLSVPQYNEKIAGMSIPATVKERSGNCVRVHFHMDPEYVACPNQKYYVYAIESSFIYCMPEVGSQVHIYFPTSDERSAIGVHAIRMGAAGGSGKTGGGQPGGGYGQNPECKSFSNVDGAALQLTPDSASAAADRGMLTCVQLGQDGTASIQGMDVVLDAAGMFSMGEPSGEDGKPVEELTVEGAEITVQVGEGDGTQIVITDEVKVIADEVFLNASVFAPVSPSKETIASELTAGDKEARDNANLAVMQPAVEKYVEGKEKVANASI